jgi:predicted Zn-ribbon and HTH transcriptional regulator
MNTEKCICKLCGHTWLARVEKPKACPRCKRFDWEKKVNNEKS